MKQWIVIGIVALAASMGVIRAEQLTKADQKAIESANEFVLRGNAFVEKNSLPRAKAEYERALRIFPRHVDALYNLAVVYEKLNQPDDAIATYKRYLDIKPNDADVWTQLGVRYDEENHPIEAQAAYEKALAVNPNFVRAHNNLGVLLKDQGKFAAAQQHLETFVRLEEKRDGAEKATLTTASAPSIWPKAR
jgi:Tfp pilus assembly protein PilF